ncbi:MAG: Ger(x)C family spore germination protein [Clostridia bacterium]|nr:Ger(x)C family spore germination protein [Clostridia bacterium]
MRKAVIVLLVFFTAFYTFNSEEIYKKDIRNRLVIQGIGIDVEDDNKYSVTIQAIDTNAQSASSSDSASQPPLKAYKMQGDTIYTALKSVTETEGKIPLYSQNRIIILGKSITEENMADVIDFFVRDVENSSSVYIAAAEKTAGEILEAKNGQEYISARSIETGISSYEYDARIFELQLFDLINRYNSGTKDFAMPLLSLKEEKGEKSVEISGTALFNSTKYREKISKDETVFLNILYDKLNNTALSYDMDDNKKVSLNIVDSKTTRTVKIKNGQPVFKIKVKMEADISEISGGVSSAMKDKDIEKIALLGEKYIEKETKNLIYSLYEEYNSDSVGLGRLIYILHKDFYRKNEKNLDSVLQNSIYEVEVDLKIRRIGHEFIMG